MTNLRIERILITGLFGMFRHDIKLNVEENITIIHGPNGVGKTTILKMLTDLFKKGFYRIVTYPFDALEIHFTNQKYIKLSKESGDERNKITVQFLSGAKPKQFKIDTSERKYRRRFPLQMVDDFIPTLERIGPEKWIDRNSNEVLSFTDVLYRFSDELPFDESDLGKQSRIPPDFIQFVESLPIHFIQTQRLFVNPVPEEIRHRPGRRIKEATIENYSNDMITIIRDIVRESGNVSASLDRTFPNRLLTSPIPSGTNEKEIRQRYMDQNDYRNRLMTAGLIEAEDPVSLPDRELNDNDLKVLWHYLNDVDEKFKVYDNVLKKIELFKDIINSRFLYKKFNIDRNEGFVFGSEMAKHIPLKTLSSGEQHEVVLSFELTFKVPTNSLILIDEPELSLHVTWQHKFLDDLERISELNQMDFIIATHSPSIVQNKRSLMVTIPNDANNGKSD